MSLPRLSAAPDVFTACCRAAGGGVAAAERARGARRSRGHPHRQRHAAAGPAAPRGEPHLPSRTIPVWNWWLLVNSIHGPRGTAGSRPPEGAAPACSGRCLRPWPRQVNEAAQQQPVSFLAPLSRSCTSTRSRTAATCTALMAWARTTTWMGRRMTTIRTRAGELPDAAAAGLTQLDSAICIVYSLPSVHHRHDRCLLLDGAVSAEPHVGRIQVYPFKCLAPAAGT